MKLPACHSRRELAARINEFFCAHPKVHVPGGVATAEMCRVCQHWQAPAPAVFRALPTCEPPVVSRPRGPLRPACFHLGEQTKLRDCTTCRGTVRVKVFACRHSLHHETTLDECRECLDYDARLPRGSVRSWAVGMTTAPRNPPTLARTLVSLAAAGWPRPRLFAEPGTEVPNEFAHLPITRRDLPLGAWPNFFLGLAELVLRAPRADAYFMVQDDVVFCRNLRGYLEQTLWPSETAGVISPYCSATYARLGAQWHEVNAGKGLVGALTYVFPNVAARSLLSFARAVNFRGRGPHDGLKAIDAAVGLWAQTLNLPVYVHSPSLAQHIGQVSVLWPGLGSSHHRRANDFAGEDCDAARLAPAPRESAEIL